MQQKLAFHFSPSSALGTTTTRGFTRSSAALSASLGVRPSLASALSANCRPRTPQASRKAPNAALDLGVRFL
jgi:hypothetical protein